MNGRNLLLIGIGTALALAVAFILLAPAAIALSGDALDEGPGRKLLAEQVGAKDAETFPVDKTD